MKPPQGGGEHEATPISWPLASLSQGFAICPLEQSRSPLRFPHPLAAGLGPTLS